MSCHSKETLENMLENVVNVLELPDSVFEKEGAFGTPTAELVKIALQLKDDEISKLKSILADAESPKTCKWTRENGWHFYSTECGNDYELWDEDSIGNHLEKGFKYCPFCQKPIEIAKIGKIYDVDGMKVEAVAIKCRTRISACPCCILNDDDKGNLCDNAPDCAVNNVIFKLVEQGG